MPDLAQLPDRSLLEAADLPFSELVDFAMREGRRPRPIYQIHKWFARRLGCSFRALLVGATADPTADFWKAYYETASLEGLTVLDPFVGGGTSVVEAARLGASVIGVDVDPIACAVTSAELSASNIEDLLPSLEFLKRTIGKEIAPLYRANSPADGTLTALHYFWVQVVQCPSCTKVGEAHPNYVLSEVAGEKRWAFCRKCNEPHELDRTVGGFRCRSCGTDTTLSEAPVRNGAYRCPHCKTQTPLIALGRSSSVPPQWKLFAVEASPRTSGRAVPLKERIFLPATPYGKASFTRASSALRLELQDDPNFLPQHRIESIGRVDSRLSDYGYSKWSQLFNDRQLLHLGRLARAIRTLPVDIRGVVGLAFSNHLTTNCMLTSYATGWRRLTPLFSIRAFRHVPRPIELNPWSDGTGRGTFPNAIRQVIRASEYAKAPKEPVAYGGFRNVASVSPHCNPRVFSGNARDLRQVSTNSVDIVLTDPPYFDNITYSELSDFFQPWLEHLGLVPKEEARRKLVRQALKANRAIEGSGFGFGNELGEAFKEMNRVLKPGGLLAFSFRHSTGAGWAAMAQALGSSDLRPTQVLPLPGEAGTGLHAHDGTSLWDAVLVFRKLKTSPPTLTLSRHQIDKARLTAAEWHRRFRDQSRLPFNVADHVNLCRAHLVAASLGLYGASDGTGIPLLQALEEDIPIR